MEVQKDALKVQEEAVEFLYFCLKMVMPNELLQVFTIHFKSFTHAIFKL